MNIETIRLYLDQPSSARDWFHPLGLRDFERAHQALVNMATAGVTLDLLAVMCDQLSTHLPLVSDADMVLTDLERFVLAARSPLSLASLFERDTNSLPPLLQIFSAS